MEERTRMWKAHISCVKELRLLVGELEGLRKAVSKRRIAVGH